MADEETTLNTKGLDKIIKAFKGKMPEIRVGILGSSPRPDGTSNALIGAVHEFGSPARNIPQRSFLRKPLTENLDKALQNNGLLRKQSLDMVFQEGNFDRFVSLIAQTAEQVVLESFEKSGPGWPAWKSPTYSNNTGQLLIDTNQLRNSITSEIVSKS